VPTGMTMSATRGRGGHLLALALLVVGCGGTVASAAPVPTIPAARLSVEATGPDEVRLGDSLYVEVAIKNEDTAANAGRRFEFAGLGDYADLKACRPECVVSPTSATYTEPLKPGNSIRYRFEFVTKARGVAGYTVCLFDSVTGGSEVWCGDSTTAIR
jgi:hypothetical protein